MTSSNKFNSTIRRTRRLFAKLNKEEIEFESTTRAQSPFDSLVQAIGTEKPLSIEMKIGKKGFGTTSEGHGDNGKEVSTKPFESKVVEEEEKVSKSGGDKNLKKSPVAEETPLKKFLLLIDPRHIIWINLLKWLLKN